MRVHHHRWVSFPQLVVRLSLAAHVRSRIEVVGVSGITSRYGRVGDKLGYSCNQERGNRGRVTGWRL